MYRETSFSGGGAASAFGTGPPLALYDLIGQKGTSVSYAYSCDMSVVGEEDEEEEGEESLEEGKGNTVPAHHGAEAPQPQASPPARGRGSDSVPHEQQPRDEATDYLDPDVSDRHLPPPPPLPPAPTTDYTRPQITQRETYPQQSPKRPTDWQTIRYMTVPGRGGAAAAAHKAQLEAWVAGWSESISQLGEETYCACADSTATTTPSSSDESGWTSSSPPLTREASRKDVLLSDIEKDGRRGRSHEEEEGYYPNLTRRNATGKGTGGRQVSFVCHNCSRLPSPAVMPDQDFVFPPSSGAGKMALKCKLVWKRIVDRTVLRRADSQSPDPHNNNSHGKAENISRPALLASTAAAAGAGYGAGLEEDDDDGGGGADDEVDLDRLTSSSSSGGKAPRAGDDLAERQARLKRAQRLLRREGKKMREAG